MGAQNPHGPVIGWGLPNQRKKERKKKTLIHCEIELN